MSKPFKIFQDMVIFSIFAHSIMLLSKFKVDDFMTNFYNVSEVNSINVSSQIEFTPNFTQIDYLQGKYLPAFYKSNNEDIYHNILNHPNFTCYTPETIQCIKDTSNNFNYLYGNLGYYHCGIQKPEEIECEKLFATTFLDTNYQIYISSQNRYNIKTLISGLSFLLFKVAVSYFVIKFIYFLKLTLDFVEHLFGIKKTNIKYKLD